MKQPHTLHVESPAGTKNILLTAEQTALPLTDILRQAGLPLNTRCGQKGLCNGCNVDLLQGRLVNKTSDQITCADQTPLTIRGCEHRWADDPHVVIHISPRSLLSYAPQVVSDFKINVSGAHNPLAQVIEVPCNPPCDNTGFSTKLKEVIQAGLQSDKPIQIDMAIEKQIDISSNHPGNHALLEWRQESWLVSQLQPDPMETFGVAIDIGTTTVAVILVDLRDGRIVAKASDFNQQIHLGDNVLTRINLCLTNPEMITSLHEAIAEQTLAPLIQQVLQDANVPIKNLNTMVVTGNTIMLHLLIKEDPGSMGTVPFTPRFREQKTLSSRTINLIKTSDPSPTNNDYFPTVHLLPSAAAYVGADLVAGALSSGLIYDDGPSLLVDIGTNGEIILKFGDKILGCATAAGPAFEGHSLNCGMRAGQGAISHIQLATDPFELKTEVIQLDQPTTKPIGICGSAYIDFLAQGRQSGLLTHTGRFNKEAIPELADQFFEAEKDYSWALRIAYGKGKQDIYISEKDIAALLQAKAAIAAGITVLLDHIAIKPAQVKTLYLAGGFGLHLDLTNTTRCGLLPGFVPDQIQLVGNTALAGAYLALMDHTALEELTNISNQIDVLELNQQPEFEDRFIDHLQLDA